MLDTIGYFKASNTDAADRFGSDIALSGDGTLLAVGAPGEDSNATGINSDDNNNVDGSGAAYLFRLDEDDWLQEAYVKASNTDDEDPEAEWYRVEDAFGADIALSVDGKTLAVGAPLEDSNSTEINGDQDDNSANGSGAVYLFRHDGIGWHQQAYIKSSNSDGGRTSSCDSQSEGEYCWGDRFGSAVALSRDGNTLAVAAISEDSGATGVNGDQSDNSASSAGAVYVFRFDGMNWVQEAYVKASNTSEYGAFGKAIALSADGSLLAVGAPSDNSGATGINGDQDDSSAHGSGAVFVFRFDGTNWSQEAYVKASNTDGGDHFGDSVALSSDGNRLAVGACTEGSSATGINGDQDDNSVVMAGAVYVFRFDGLNWAQEAYVKASNTEEDQFGYDVALSGDGNTLAVAAISEDSGATGIDGDQYDNSATYSGAIYIFRFDGMAWSQQSYVKATNTGAWDKCCEVALAADGSTLAIGTGDEDSSATGINGDQDDDSQDHAGAVYVY
ncbi:MAG: hypothetical protein AMS22_13960 [Thiotrichales bacterium SG8_50]|nr:MAG: hypothetical protein AMS22_13960 [Thiotrichales bacterium SG8_50]